MIVPDALDAAMARRWAQLALTGLERSQDEIDGLNVFPIPDRDTGTNMTSTLRSAVVSLAALESDAVDAALAALAGGAVLGARGNSGVILAQLLRGLATAADGRADLDAVTLRAALAHAVDGAYGAVGDPIEGTMLTVARGAAEAAALAPDTLGAVVGAAFTGACVALAGTTAQLDALRAAGVVDAGGRGLVVVFEALVEAVRGEPGPVASDGPATEVAGATTSPARPAAHDPGPVDNPFAYEVQYLLAATAADVEVLGGELGRLGDSVAIADGGDGRWNVHVHADDVGAAIEAGIRAGRPYRIEVTRFADQLGSSLASGSAPGPVTPGAPRPAAGVAAVAEPGEPAGVAAVGGVALVAVGPRAGLAQVFSAQGVQVVSGDAAGGGADGRPGEDDVLAAIEACATGSVIVLPDPDQPGDAVERAAARARSQGIVVAVLPTRSAVQALAAVAVHDAGRRFEDDVIRMAESAAATRWSEVSIAEGEALTSAGRCHAGDVLGLIEGEVVVLGSDPVAVGLEVIGRLLGVGGELVTVLLGGASPAGAAEALTRGVARIAPHAEIDVVAVGQPGRVLSIGVE